MDDILWQKDWCGVFIDFRDAYTQGAYATWILQFFFGSLLCNLNSVYGEWDGTRSALLSILLTPHALMSSWEPCVQLHRLLPFSAYRTVTAGSSLTSCCEGGKNCQNAAQNVSSFSKAIFPVSHLLQLIHGLSTLLMVFFPYGVSPVNQLWSLLFSGCWQSQLVLMLFWTVSFP